MFVVEDGCGNDIHSMYMSTSGGLCIVLWFQDKLYFSIDVRWLLISSVFNLRDRFFREARRCLVFGESFLLPYMNEAMMEPCLILVVRHIYDRIGPWISCMHMSHVMPHLHVVKGGVVYKKYVIFWIKAWFYIQVQCNQSENVDA